MLSSTSKEITWVHSHIKLCYWSTAVVGLFWGGSKCQAHCLNFDRWKIVIKISHEFLYKEIHMTFWRSFCLDQNSNILTRILTLPQNSPTTAVESSLIDSSVSKLIKCSKIWFFTADCKKVGTTRFGNKQNTSKPNLRVCCSRAHPSVTGPLFIIGSV